MKSFILFIILAICTTSIFSQEYKVIVNKSNAVSEITKKDLAIIMLKKKSKWDSGEKVIPVDLKSNSPARTSFSKDIFNKPVSAIKSYWQQYTFSGRGTPPVEKESDAAIIDFVKSNVGAIGYISVGVNTVDIKIVKISD